MQTNTALKLTLLFSILYIGTNALALGKGSTVSGGETVQRFHVDDDYHRVKKNGFAFRRLTRTKRLEGAAPPSSQKLLIRAKRLDMLEAAKEANMARAKRFAKLVHDNSAGRLLIRTKRRDLVEPVVTNKHHGGSHQSEKHHDGHHETKHHHDGKANVHNNNKENKKGGRKESHGGKKAMLHKRKESHDGESHSKMAKRHDLKQTHLNKKDAHLKKNLHASQHGKNNRNEKKETHHMERSKKNNGHKEKKEKKHSIHKVGGAGYHNKKVSGGGGHGGHSGHESNLRNSRASAHQKWKRNVKRIAMVNYLKKSKKLNLKQ